MGSSVTFLNVTLWEVVLMGTTNRRDLSAGSVTQSSTVGGRIRLGYERCTSSVSKDDFAPD